MSLCELLARMGETLCTKLKREEGRVKECPYWAFSADSTRDVAEDEQCVARFLGLLK